MSLDDSLRRVDHDIAAGDTGRARDRLHGLISTYSDNLDLRRRLGEVYWKLRDPAMAGRYWYLEENQSVDMLSARKTFERSCGGNPVKMLLAIKYRGGMQRIKDTHAESVLLDLQRRAGSERRIHIKIEGRGRGRYQYLPPKGYQLAIGSLQVIGCLLVVILAIVGSVTAFQWLVNLIP